MKRLLILVQPSGFRRFRLYYQEPSMYIKISRSLGKKLLIIQVRRCYCLCYRLGMPKLDIT